MNILVLGSGGREHALAWKIAASPLVTKLWCAPGNAGIAQDAECVALDIADHPAVIAFCKMNKVDFVVVGPDAAIAAGVVDDLNAAGFKAFGPTKAAGQLESSKNFTKQLCRDNNIPTAAYEHFKSAEAAKTYIRKQGAPIVVKADGLAAGKGVVVAMTLDEALAAVDMMFGGGFGDAGAEVVVEEFMEGEEASFFVLCDGEYALPLATAQDHKRAFDGDKGPNTGGMGAYSPAPVVTQAVYERVCREVIEPTLAGMRAEGRPFTGFLYAGLMIDKQERVKVLEFNTRMGDPETQPIMVRLESDLLDLLQAALDRKLDQVDVRWSAEPAIGVVLAAAGYPGTVEKGDVINGLDADLGAAKVFHAGTAERDGQVVTSGGRVLCVVAKGRDIATARATAYAAVDKISWRGLQFRRDIAHRALGRI